MRLPEDLHPRPLPILRQSWDRGPSEDEALHREWLITNGLGSYASGTLGMCPTRRYHGLFVPCLATWGRTVMLARLEEEAQVAGGAFRLDGLEAASGELRLEGARALRCFELEGLLPRWQYQVGPSVLTRELVLVHLENTLFVAYHHHGGPELRLRLRPVPVQRTHESPLVDLPAAAPLVRIVGDRLELSADERSRPMQLRTYGAQDRCFIAGDPRSERLSFRQEQRRGYSHTEVQTSPGCFEATLRPGQTLVLGVTVQGFEALDRAPLEAFDLERQRERHLLEQAPPAARSGTPARLVLAADQFIVDPAARPADEAWARSVGGNARSIIAGYHWFTDWGRDTMISLEGLALCTRRHAEAKAILRTFRHHVRDGLLPNLFPEGEREGLYHTADATLWFFHAVDRCARASGDHLLVKEFLPTLAEIVDCHLEGTRFGIGVDPVDGLLRQGQAGYPLTWMDAKVDGWVVTPRRGKAVELNALWFNALRSMAEWSAAFAGPSAPYARHAERAQASFNARFWNPAEGCLFDLVDGEGGDDPAVRPNQLFAISLPHPVLARERWGPVVQRVRAELLTPVGLRTLAPSHPDFKASYDGDLRARDAAYHQGTVWAWLLGPYFDAELKLGVADPRELRGLLRGLEAQLESACLGQLSEIFDATDPFRARGCVAQAWSVAEALRCWLLTEQGAQI